MKSKGYKSGSRILWKMEWENTLLQANLILVPMRKVQESRHRTYLLCSEAQEHMYRSHLIPSAM